MRKIFVIILYNLSFLSLYAMRDDGAMLREAGKSLCTDTANKVNKQLFFDAFPASFDAFNYVFSGRRDSLTDHVVPPIIENYTKFIDLFFTLPPCIDTDSFCNKIIHICLSGYWEIGAVSSFQFMLLNFALKDYLYKGRIKNHPLWRNLNKYSDEEIGSFWHFYLDYATWIDKGLYIRTKTKLTKSTMQKYPRQKRLLTQESERMIIYISNMQ